MRKRIMMLVILGVRIWELGIKRMEKFKELEYTRVLLYKCIYMLYVPV